MSNKPSVLYEDFMYARQLSIVLHQALATPEDYGVTLQRFEALRGYGLLPQGRENAAVKLTNKQISSAILGFVPTSPSWAGHVSLVLGGLRAVGGPSASILGSETLLESVSAVMTNDQACSSLVTLTLSTAREQGGAEYYAKGIFEETGNRKIISYVSHMAMSLLRAGSEKDFDHEQINAPSARQLVLTADFFNKLRRHVAISRHLDLPFETDWREYESEEKRNAFHRKLGARRNSRFLNLGVDTDVIWPKEPTRVEFGGHCFVIFPRTKDNSQSVSIDLTNEYLSEEDARTLLNRFLSILSWCHDRHAVLKSGWSGNPVPVPVQRSEGTFGTTSQWFFSRSMPDNDELLQRLAYFREGLNARDAGLVTFEVLSFYKVFEKREPSIRGKPNPTKQWIARVYSDATRSLDLKTIERFDADRKDITVERYIFENCRVATAHTSEAVPSDADASPERRRLHSAAEVIHALARHFIRTEYGLSESYFSDDASL